MHDSQLVVKVVHALSELAHYPANVYLISKSALQIAKQVTPIKEL
jgi:hypothetical protein